MSIVSLMQLGTYKTRLDYAQAIKDVEKQFKVDVIGLMPGYEEGGYPDFIAWTAEGQTPLVGIEWWGCRGGLMVDPSVRRRRCPVAGWLIPGCGVYCAPAENMP